MSAFRPHPGMTLQIGPARYIFLPHPLFPNDMEEVSLMEGGEAFVYQLQDIRTAAYWALKVSKPSTRGEHIARTVTALAPYSQLPGLALGNRLCLDRARFPELIAQFPDLEYSVLMPWLAGRTWAGFLADRAASEAYSEPHALALTRATAQVLWNLEAHHLAHTDIAGSNVVLSPEGAHVELLDVENLYMPQTPTPRYTSHGTPGYQHPHLGSQGNWRPDGDRFAGAILLTEMLVWADPLVRRYTPEGAESLFQPHELQTLHLPRWQAARDALWAMCPAALTLFDQAWASNDLSECPELSSWAMALVQSGA
ncbi:MAG TPA: hypothetical protein VF120_01935 [Ktedonobacterales bacterium]